ncbi:MAG: hypothetical protein L0Z50_37445 [Verrucomicrobiales bacterium]|nr:hypothetical protein [Verrucomicrobiales bacterium]
MKKPAFINGVIIQHIANRRPNSLWDLVRLSSKERLTKATVLVLLAWLPAGALSLLGGMESLVSFLTDIATQSRLLIAIPVLVLAYPFARERIEHLQNQFLLAGVVPDDEQARFQSIREFCNALRTSALGDVLMALLAFLSILGLLAYVNPSTLRPWLVGRAPFDLSVAGTWFAFVSLPILAYLLFSWMWNHMVWAWFLRKVSRLPLTLTPAHPDQVGGLAFLEGSLKAYYAFGLVVGLIAAGGAANRIVHHGRSLTEFKGLALFVIAFVLLVAVGPLAVFARTLAGTKFRGICDYGPLASAVGQRFYWKWVRTREAWTEEALTAQDFSAMTDLYQVVGNVYAMKVLPIGLTSVTRLLAYSVAPAIPVALAAVPFDIIVSTLVKHLL